MEDLLSTAEAEVTSYKEELSEAQSRASSLERFRRMKL